MSSRQVVKVEHKVSVAAFTSRDEKWVGEGREEDTTEERCEGERECRFCLKVTGKGCKTGANVSVPMCLGPPSRGQKAPLRIHKSCLLHMSSRTQHTGGIHKAVSCICNSNIQGCSTLGDPHPVLTVPSFPPPLTTENSLKNPCNVICTNK